MHLLFILISKIYSFSIHFCIIIFQIFTIYFAHILSPYLSKSFLWLHCNNLFNKFVAKISTMQHEFCTCTGNCSCLLMIISSEVNTMQPMLQWQPFIQDFLMLGAFYFGKGQQLPPLKTGRGAFAALPWPVFLLHDRKSSENSAYLLPREEYSQKDSYDRIFKNTFVLEGEVSWFFMWCFPKQRDR